MINQTEGKRRWSPEEKLAIVNETYTSGMSVTSVAKIYGVHPNQLSGWRKDARLGKLVANPGTESVELAIARRRIRELERLLGAKMLEVELLRSGSQVGTQCFGGGRTLGRTQTEAADQLS